MWIAWVIGLPAGFALAAAQVFLTRRALCASGGMRAAYFLALILVLAGGMALCFLAGALTLIVAAVSAAVFSMGIVAAQLVRGRK